MSQRRITCFSCGCEIQSNTPLEHGGTTMPVPGLCDDCRRAKEEDDNDVANAIVNVCKAQANSGCSLDGLRYALDVVKGRRILNRPPAYLAALDEIEIFLLAAIHRVEHGEPMHSTAVCQ